MARYSAGMTTTIAGTALRPVFGLLNLAAVTGQLREIGIYNTTTTACAFRLVQVTGGTPGADQVERRHRRNSPAASVLAKAGWTADATVDEDMGYRIDCGAAIGSGGILTFGGDGLEAAVGATVALGVIPVGTGQIVNIYAVWDE